MVGPCLVNWGGPGLNQSWSEPSSPDAPESVQVYLRTVSAYASVLNSQSHPQDIPWRSYPTKSLAACTSFWVFGTWCTYEKSSFAFCFVSQIKATSSCVVLKWLVIWRSIPICVSPIAVFNLIQLCYQVLRYQGRAVLSSAAVSGQGSPFC